MRRLFAAAISLFAACSSTPEAACESVTVEGGTYCVYQGPITETGYDCPPDMPNMFRDEMRDLIACTAADERPPFEAIEAALSAERNTQNSGGCPGILLTVEGAEFCARRQTDEGIAECLPDYPFLVTDDWSLYVCAADDGTDVDPTAIYAAYEEQVCAPLMGESACETQLCEWIPAENRFFYENDMCTATSAGICVADVGEYGNALGCNTRAAGDGRLEVIQTSSLLVEAGWQTDGESFGSDTGPCSCLTN